MKQNLNASVIFPVNDTRKANRLITNLANRFTNFQLLPISDAPSFFASWKVGLAKSTKKYLILTHQDVEILKIPSLDRLFTDTTGLVGPAGSTVITRQEPWWFSPTRLDKGQLSGSVFHSPPGGKPTLSYYGKYSPVVALDGVCLITKKSQLQKVGIPDVDWAKWDFYDQILSFEYQKCGYSLKTVPIKLIHSSPGLHRPEFFTSQHLFLKQYLQ